MVFGCATGFPQPFVSPRMAVGVARAFSFVQGLDKMDKTERAKWLISLGFWFCPVVQTNIWEV
jgi:hypothetical protein